MTRTIDLTGQKFGKLTVIERKGTNIRGYAQWYCKCDCGKNTLVAGCNLRSGDTKSCGCLSIKHGQTRLGDKFLKNKVRSKAYSTWTNIKQRCYAVTNPLYKDYGGKGIKICQSWLDSFENFLHDMGDVSDSKNFLCRKDNNKDYEPDNCYWGTKSEQSDAQFTYGGETRTLTDWAKIKNLKYSTLRARIYVHGWAIEKALETPTKNQSPSS